MSNTADDNKIITERVTQLQPEEFEPIQPRPWYTRLGRRLVALIFILAMLFLGGVYQFGLFQQTSESTPVGQYEKIIDRPTLRLPTTVFVVSTDVRSSTSSVRKLTSKANTILKQAAVALEPVRVQNIIDDDGALAGGDSAVSRQQLQAVLPELDSSRLSVVVVSGLGGINGVAFPGRQLTAVAEYNTSFDFRVLAHEVGHILSLGHVQDKNNLMYSGSTGTKLNDIQAQAAYQKAQTILDNS